MEISSSVASKLGELLVEATINQARYLLCFNSIINELKDKETNLKEAKGGINEKIEQERQIHRAIVIEKDVEKWLKDVDKEMADVRNLKAKIDEKKSCLNGWCPNWGWRCWLGRKASKKTSELSDLQKKCGKFSSIIEALKRDSTTIVGLYGISGVGKTTLANFVGNQLRQEKIFDEVGIATVSQDPDIIKVQGELAKSLGWALNEKHEKERADRLRLMFSESKSSKILIILDDVWNELDLKTIGIPVGDGDNCYKILLTTRLQPVCDRMRCDPQIQLGVLKQEEGLALLREHAGIVVSNSTLIGVSERVADECKGLPLAIKAVGSALKGKGFDEWNLALDKLQDAKLNTIECIGNEDQDVYRCLKFSCDYLNDEDSRSCFLLCSLFPEDYEIDLDDLVGYAVGLRWYRAESIEKVRSLLSGTIKELKASSLLLDAGNDRFVKTHDIVRDVALWIGSMEKKYFTSKVGIGLAEQAVEKYKGIFLMGNEKKELPSGLLIRCKVSDASFLGKLKRLQIVCVNGSPIEVPEEFEDQLSRLKLLLFIDSGSISPITIKKFPQLEEFYGWIKDWEAEGMSSEESYARAAELNSQPDDDEIQDDDGKTLHIEQKIVRLSKDFTFPKLQMYFVSNCNKLEVGTKKEDEFFGRSRLECIVEAKFDHNEGEISVRDGNTMLALPLLRELTLRTLEELQLHYCPNLTINSIELKANLQYLKEMPLLIELRSLGVELNGDDCGALIANFRVRPTLIHKVHQMQAQDPQLMQLKEDVQKCLRTDFTVRGNGVLVMGNRLCVHDIKDPKEEIME
ncbi:disease resistance protein At4g27190-like [Citrus sinensis]|uniref:disease resistance protein At4g27190-like n=1 Tax=Citrus sinensis TaxID=2711 RepID=UPI002279C720|nr:disease resistance protein At4g27190-like [Citrus sinensis]